MNKNNAVVDCSGFNLAVSEAQKKLISLEGKAKLAGNNQNNMGIFNTLSKKKYGSFHGNMSFTVRCGNFKELYDWFYPKYSDITYLGTYLVGYL